LHSDPEYRPCLVLRKKVKNIQKLETTVNQHLTTKKWQLAITELGKAVAALSEGDHFHHQIFERQTCFAYLELKKPIEAVRHCNKALKLRDNDADALIYRAEAHILGENFEAAVNDYKTAHNLRKDRAVFSYFIITLFFFFLLSNFLHPAHIRLKRASRRQKNC